MDRTAFVQRKTNQELKAGTRPTELQNLNFLGHALYGDTYWVFFDGSGSARIPGPSSTQPSPPFLYNFELSTLTLVAGFSFIAYRRDIQGNYVLTPSTEMTTKPTIFPLLVNLLPSTVPHPFVPDCWHTCENEDDKILHAGKFGCPRLLFGLNGEILLLRYNNRMSVLDTDPLVPFDSNGKPRTPLPDEYESPYLIPMVMANQSLVYYIVPEPHILNILSAWEDNIQNYRNKPQRNLFFKAELPIVFNDDMQIFCCQDVQINELPDSVTP